MLTNEQLYALKQIAGEANVSAGDSERGLHSHDQSSHAPHLPDAVAWPENTAQVSKLAAYANAQGIALTGWGAGSSLEGNSIPLRGGIVVDFGKMNRILTVHASDFQVTVQPGIFYKDMNKQLAAHGLFFAPDPGANASVGGMIANNAAGTRTVKYGATRDNVLALEVVLANGDVIRTGARTVKQSAGYDLTHLFVGSEGTLGLISEATLKLAPLPEHFSAVVASFATTEAAAEAVFGIIGSGLNPAALELLDTATIKAINAADNLSLAEAPNLFLEFHGASEEALTAELRMVEQVCTDAGCQSFTAGQGREARDRLWQARHNLGTLLFRKYAGKGYLIADVAVPISHYPALVAEAADALAHIARVEGFIFGHAGDGNLHSVIFFDQTPEEYARVQQAFNDKVVAKALSAGGTCTGEHGVGIGKQRYMLAEHGEIALDWMRRLKALWDPKGILNPGKILADG